MGNAFRGGQGPVQEKGSKEKASDQEAHLLRLIDQADAIRRYGKHMVQMNKGTMQVPGFFRAVAHDAAMVMAQLMISGDSDKIKLEAAKDILDRAGHNKTTKMSIAGQMNVSHETSKLELINIIMSSAKKAGIRTKSDPEFLEVARTPETIDVTASVPSEFETASVVPASKEDESDDGC